MSAIIDNPSKMEWAELTKRPVIHSVNLTAIVSEIIRTVKEQGDIAIRNYSLQFHNSAPVNLWVTEDEIENSSKSVSKDLQKAIL